MAFHAAPVWFDDAKRRRINAVSQAYGHRMVKASLFLAVEKPASGAEPHPKPRLAASDPPTVLCIEDDRDMAALIGEELESRGFRVLLAHDGQQGLSLLLKAKPDVILSDINLPTMTGLELLEALNEHAPRFARVPFIFLTALNGREDELKGRRLGADDYIAKPVDFDVLHAIIDARLKGVARRNVWKSQCDLNDREIEALMWAARGKTTEDIAAIMSITERTVHFHLNNARDKLGVATRIQAAVKATVAGFIEP
jgi:DNA-binding NarL/FixJ family response regulator